MSPMENIKLHKGYRSTERQCLFISTPEGAYYFFPIGFLDYPLWTLPRTSCPGLGIFGNFLTHRKVLPAQSCCEFPMQIEITVLQRSTEEIKISTAG